jgi:DNA-directed RNA polymerase specialized sigma24 family protein
MAPYASLTERLNLFMQGDQVRGGRPAPRSAAQAARDSRPRTQARAVHGAALEDRIDPRSLAEQPVERRLADSRSRPLLRAGQRWRCGASWWTWPASGWPPAGAPAKPRLPLDESGALLGPSERDAQQIVEIGLLMERLEAKDPDAARMVDMHYFSGFTLEEIAKRPDSPSARCAPAGRKGMKWLKRMLQSDR